MVTLQVTNPANVLVYAQSVTTTTNGAFNVTVYPGASNLWIAGTYTVKASYGTLSATSKFTYAPTTTVLTTTTQLSTVTSPTTMTQLSTVMSPTTVTVSSTQTVTGPTSVLTSTQTIVSTMTQTTSSVPSWAYGAMIALLIIGLALGYLLMGRWSRSVPKA